tara:strand:- start:84 stop:428 length:345 start_codon:yes stop_codon:yes gene_type:complete
MKGTSVVVEKTQRGVLYMREVNGECKWFKDGNEKTDEKYEGEIVNGVPNGQGTLTYPDGDQYVGEWKDGEYHGQGTYISSDGDKYVGEWKNSEPWTITEYNKDGNNLDLFVNGK